MSADAFWSNTLSGSDSRANFRLQKHLTLNEREVEILELYGKGYSSKTVSRKLYISPFTVKWHLKNIFSKLYVGSREEALERARDLKLIERNVCAMCSCGVNISLPP